jgi:tryptophanyl-tRNA synthetase
MRIVSGIQPSGPVHLGNYLGALRQLLELASGPDRPFCFIADLHALTTVHDGARLAARTREMAVELLALGFGADRCVLFVQSAVAELTRLAWALATVTPMPLLARGHAYKEKVDQGLTASVGLFTYPVLMAADVLAYDADLVPVGPDQLQHLELARDMATKMNLAFDPGWDPASADAARSGLVHLPAALVRENTALVPGTDGRKMSKSYGNTLDLFADDRTLERQVMHIVTDSTPVAAPKPEPHPLLELVTVLCEPDEGREHTRTWRQGGVGYGAYKRRLLERLHERFDEARRRRAALERDPALVDRVLAAGLAEARGVAAQVWARVARALGVW